MKYVYPDHIAEQKADHAQRMNQTTQDDLYYKEPEPLTEDQKLQLLHQEEERKKKYIQELEFRRRWMEKNFEGTELRDHYNH